MRDQPSKRTRRPAEPPAAQSDAAAEAESRADTARTEAFSDGVFAIAITLLVLDLALPPHSEGHLARSLLELWPAYAGFLASFVYIGVLWLNHHAAFRRICSIDRALNWANLGLLLGAVVLPFPTAVLSDAFRTGNRADEQTAIMLYALVAVGMSISWLVFFHTLYRRGHLVHVAVDPATIRTERLRPLPGILGYTLAAVLGIATSPFVSLALFLALPVFYAVTSEGARPALRAQEPTPSDSPPATKPST